MAHVAGTQNSYSANIHECFLTFWYSAPKVETSYEIESPHDPERVAAVLRNARNGCWVRAAVANPTPFEDKSTLNGEPIYFD